MLFLPAAALCWLGSALAAMATQLVQDDLTLTRREGESVSFSCGTGQCGYDEYRYWYQKKETFKIIFRYRKSNCRIEQQYNHPQNADFSLERIENGCSLKIKNVRDIHSASYYCSCLVWSSTVRNNSFSLNKNLQMI
uniref:Immunoglobulin V-set domain-containing protein n=1 Tax=Poecilia formosa TaxID=48698 RepID=A0A096M0J0_POEFO